jgi:hypothetical protein
MQNSGGYCLPDFIKEGVNVWFAIDNIDLLEDTPNGQNTFHGTVVVINQRSEDGKSVNEKLVMPSKKLTPLSIVVQQCSPPAIQASPMKFSQIELDKCQISSQFTRIWTLASFFSAANSSVVDQESVSSEGTDLNQDVVHCETSETTHECEMQERGILSLNETTTKKEKVSKNEVMPTWSASNTVPFVRVCINQKHKNQYRSSGSSPQNPGLPTIKPCTQP